MVDLFPCDVESRLLRFIKHTYLPTRHKTNSTLLSSGELHFFAPAVAALSEAFTSERATLPKNYFNKKELRSAYLLYFFPTNYAKVMHCLGQLHRLERLPQGDIVDVLDVGCGHGTASIACAHIYSRFARATRLAIEGVDHTASVLADARALFQTLCAPEHRFHGTSSLPHKHKRRFDLIFAVNVFNECRSMNEKYELIARMKDLLKPSGVLLVIDPALQRTTRDLMEMRDALVSEKLLFPLAPCLHTKNCPMRAANRRDWCHFYIEWRCPEIMRKLDALVGNKHDYLKMAYFIFAQDPGSRSLDPEKWRVVSSPMISKGKTEMLLCGSSGELRRIRQLDRDVKKGRLSIQNMKRGDILTSSLECQAAFNVPTEASQEVR